MLMPLLFKTETYSYDIYCITYGLFVLTIYDNYFNLNHVSHLKKYKYRSFSTGNQTLR